jgi:hypothetical protein
MLALHPSTTADILTERRPKRRVPRLWRTSEVIRMAAEERDEQSEFYVFKKEPSD